jgi:hypothetical protein
MNLTIAGRAQEFISQQGGVISVRIEKRLIPGCGAMQTADAPAVRLGKPEDHEKANFEAVTIDGIQVYAHSSVVNYNAKIPLLVDIETTLFGNRLAMYGLPLPRQSCGDCTSC